jgi:hypothetical protein
LTFRVDRDDSGWRTEGRSLRPWTWKPFVELIVESVD